MSVEIIKRLYLRMKNYCLIKEMAADAPKVANAANDEIYLSFVEGIYKYNAVDEFINLLQHEEDDIFKLVISTLLLGYKKEPSMNIIYTLKKSKNHRVSESADNIISERYSTISQLVDSYSTIIKGYQDRLGLSTL